MPGLGWAFGGGGGAAPSLEAVEGPEGGGEV